jgi:[ribosomal protein S5]-alanine N-acetyltransferase
LRILIESERLSFVLLSRAETRARIEAMTAEDRKQLSAAWLALVESSDESVPWIDGFSLVDRGTGATVGSCGFKGPPDGEAVVEIAYGIAPEMRGKGYATEAAAALTQYAFSSGNVRMVRAHTLPEKNASGRVLTKCGFQFVGEQVDPEDGLVWRWERSK